MIDTLSVSRLKKSRRFAKIGHTRLARHVLFLQSVRPVPIIAVPSFNRARKFHSRWRACNRTRGVLSCCRFISPIQFPPLRVGVDTTSDKKWARLAVSRGYTLAHACAVSATLLQTNQIKFATASALPINESGRETRGAAREPSVVRPRATLAILR